MTGRTTRRPQSRGQCLFCEKTLTSAGMRRHLAECADRAAEQSERRGASPGRGLHLVIEGRYSPEYWIHLEASPIATLADLDWYLRDLWLECCEHLSGFAIKGVTYSDSAGDAWGLEEEPTTKRISRVLRPGESGLYAYDFGSTTELRIRAVEEIPRRTGPEPIILLARNNAPEVTCACGKGPAVEICTLCRYAAGRWLCATCAPKHDCVKEFLLPVVNSPRTGVCAYTGN